MISFEHVSKIYTDNVYAVKDINLDIPDSQITVIIGPSGCGKTTTLKLVNKLIEPTDGEIKIDGKSIRDANPISLRRSIGYVIQEVGLFPHYTVFRNISVVPELFGWERKKIEDRIHTLLDLVNLPRNYKSKYPHELSGGERQRIGVARALAADPKILLMDEPFGAIDPINRKILQDFFLELQEQLKKTVLFVTHDIVEAVKMGENLMIMNRGEVVQFEKTGEVLKNPANSFVDSLIGSERSFRRIMLMKARDYMNKDFIVCERDLIKQSNAKAQIIIVKEKEKFVGYLDGDPLEDDNIKRLSKVSPEENLLDVFTSLLQSGRGLALICSSTGDPIGTINMEMLMDLLKEGGEDA